MFVIGMKTADCYPPFFCFADAISADCRLTIYEKSEIQAILSAHADGKLSTTGDFD